MAPDPSITMNVASLQKVALALAESQTVDSVLQIIVRSLAEQADVALARVWLKRPGDVCGTCEMKSSCPDQLFCLHLAASAGNPLGSNGPEANKWTQIDGHFRRIPLNAALEVGKIGGTGQPVLIQFRNVAEDYRFIVRPEWIDKQQVGSFAGQPLVFNGEILGVVGLFSRSHLTGEEFAWLRTFADNAATAIANRRAFEETQRTHDELQLAEGKNKTLLEISNLMVANLPEPALLTSICDALRRVVQFDWSGLGIYMPEKDAFEILAISGEHTLDHFRPGLELDRQQNSIGWVFDNHRPIVRTDLEREQEYANERLLAAAGMRSHCVVPLLSLGNCIGVLGVASRTPGLYSAADAEFLLEVANQVALAVGNMKAYEEIAALKARLERENTYFQEEIRREHNFDGIVGHSPELLKLLDQVECAAPTNSNVLIFGETGSGKELIARVVHSRSPRNGRPLVKVNCGAMPAGLVESELFGHVKGAFTGASETRVGRFELADGGTLFLDEVGELPLETQVKLLRVLQEQEFEPVGSNRTVKVNIRIIAATNRDLEKAVRSGQFRSDLYYRLNVIPLHVPALRERRCDIPELVTAFLEQSSKRIGKTMNAVAQDTMKLLMDYAWPGNIRELQNIIERGIVLSHGSVLRLGPDLLPVEGAEKVDAVANEISREPDSSTSLEEVQRRHILRVLEKTGWLISGPNGAGAILNIHPNTLRSLMKRLGIQRPESRHFVTGA